MGKRFQLTLTIGDFKLLMKYYFTEGLSVFNKRKLFGELNDARIVGKGSLPLVKALDSEHVVCVWENEKQILSAVVQL